MLERHGDRRTVPVTEPAPVVTEKARTATWEYDTRNGGWAADVDRRGGASPAPTLTASGLARGRDVWRYRDGNQTNAAERAMTEPAPTVHFGHNLNYVEWVSQRPATTVNGDARISRPGHHDESESGSQQRDSVRVTVTEAAVLQGFEPDVPWQGSRTSQFRQIGNAVPPPLAKAILSALMEAR